MLGMLAAWFSPMKSQAQDDPSSSPSQTDLCFYTVISSPELKALTDQIDDAGSKNNWLEIAHASAKIAEITSRCLLHAPHVSKYGHFTKAKLLISEAIGYEDAENAAYCAHREDLVDTYLSKASLLLNGVKGEPTEGLPDGNTKEYVKVKQNLYLYKHVCSWPK